MLNWYVLVTALLFIYRATLPFHLIIFVKGKLIRIWEYCRMGSSGETKYEKNYSTCINLLKLGDCFLVKNWKRMFFYQFCCWNLKILTRGFAHVICYRLKNILLKKIWCGSNHVGALACAPRIFKVSEFRRSSESFAISFR